MLRSFARSGRLALVPAFVLAVVVLSVAGPAHAAGQPQQVGGVVGGWASSKVYGPPYGVQVFPSAENATAM